VQVSRGVDDADPLVIETKIEILTQCKWDSKGSVLAVAGLRLSGDGKEVSVVQFYDAHGSYLRTLKVPGGGIKALSWEGGGLRVALAVDAYIYFANIRPDYKWAYFGAPPPASLTVGQPSGGTLCYAYTRPDRVESTVMFWDLATDERVTATVSGLRALAAGGDNCALVTGPDVVTGGFRVQLCNAIGAPVDSKALPLGLIPAHVTMTKFHVFVADGRFVYVWQYRTQSKKLVADTSGGGGSGGSGSSGGAGSLPSGIGGMAGRVAARERVVDVWECDKAEQAAGGVGGAVTSVQTMDAFVHPSRAGKGAVKATLFPGRAAGAEGDGEDGGSGSLKIMALGASEKGLVVGLESGTVQRFSLPLVQLEQRFVLRQAPALLRFNCDSTLLAHVDANGQLGIMDLEKKKVDEHGDVVVGVPVCVPRGPDGGGSGGGGDGGGDDEGKEDVGAGGELFERKDCWDMIWSADHPRSLATMEKTRMFVFEDLVATEPTLSSGYLAAFGGSEVQAVLLDDVYASPDRPLRDMVRIGTSGTRAIVDGSPACTRQCFAFFCPRQT